MWAPPQEAGVLWPRNQPRAPERAKAPPSGRGRARTEDPASRTSRRPSRSRCCRSRGGRHRVPRAGRGGRGGGGRPVLTRAGAVHPGAGALRAGGSWRAGGRGAAGLTSPPVAGGCRATVRRREEGRGPGGGGPWQPGRPGRMTMEGNALSESESGPRGRGGRGAGARGPGTHHPGRLCSAAHRLAADTDRRGARHTAPGGSAEPGTPDAAGPARGRRRAPAAARRCAQRTIPGNPDT